jgi:hypothetical protein
MKHSLFSDFDINGKAAKKERDPILYIDHNPQPNICPYCDQQFVDIVGCHKICRCGYMEGCGD